MRVYKLEYKLEYKLVKHKNVIMAELRVELVRVKRVKLVVDKRVKLVIVKLKLVLVKLGLKLKVNERLIFQLGDIQLFQQLSLMGCIQRVSLDRLKEYIRFNIQRHNNQ